MAGERRARLALAGQQRDRAGGHAAGAQRLDDPQPAARGLLGGLEHDGVAGRQRRGGHPRGDRQREVPGRDHRADAARRVVQLVALAGHLQQRRPVAALQLDRGARVELEEVDRLADVGIGLRPGLGALAHGERGQRGAPLAHPGGGAQQRGRALGHRRRGPACEGRARGGDGGAGLRGGRARGERDDALGPARVGRHELVARAAVVADPDRHAQRQAQLAHADGELRALA